MDDSTRIIIQGDNEITILMKAITDVVKLTKELKIKASNKGVIDSKLRGVAQILVRRFAETGFVS